MMMTTINNFYNMDPIGHDDVLHMSSLTLDTFLDNLRIRYTNGIYYTYIGEVCISVNPNRPNMNIYGPDYMEMYCGKPLYSMPPHIFAIADAAYRKVFEHSQNSCIIITGESGSGKTEASKLILLYITDLIKKDDRFIQKKISSVENIILYSNCILETFGNAHTIRNDNSSRFGKYIEVCFTQSLNSIFKYSLKDFVSHHSTYGVIHNYLLEKSRVIEQQNGERNFHSFYQLLSALDSKYEQCQKFKTIFKQLNLTADTRSYRYLNSSSKSIVTEKDRQNFESMIQAFNKVGFTDVDVEIIFKLLAAILHLGNVKFHFDSDEFMSNDNANQDYSQCIVADTWIHLEHFATLLSIDKLSALKTLCSRTINTPFEVLTKSYSKDEAIYGQDALAKSLYERLFKFILNKINQSLQSNKPKNESDGFSQMIETKTIGILDIYGFEVFNSRPNGFEQFLINYCNEKLHQLFVDLILNKEQALYNSEDINWKMVDYQNNLAICRLMDEPHKGIFALLDEACTSGQSYTDQCLLKVFNRRFAQNQYFQSRVLNPSQRKLHPQNDFVIRHYAGDVHYSIEGFMDKNMDQLYFDYRRLLHSSLDPLLKDIMNDGRGDDLKVSNKRPISAGLEFRKSMTDLMGRLALNQQFYIRCIKPNDDLNDSFDDRFNSEKVRHQIQYLGLVENARVRKAGFWRQIPYQTFVQRYQMLHSGEMSLENDDDDDLRKNYFPLCTKIFESTLPEQPEKYLDTNKIAYGKTMLFLRDPTLIETLEAKRFIYLQNIVIEIQAHCRTYFAQKRYKRMKTARLLFQQFCRLKRYHLMCDVIQKLLHYEREFTLTCSRIAPNFLEFYNIEPFVWPSELLGSNPLVNNDKLFIKDLPQLMDYLNHWLIILKFPPEYWTEKLIRLDAYKIFSNKKTEWGQSRRRWVGNYLVNHHECTQSARFKNFFHDNSYHFKTVRFVSYALKTNARSIDQICAIVLTDSDIFKLDIDDLSYVHCCNIKFIESVSVTTGPDQLVVVHLENSKNDLVFSFCSLKESIWGISTTLLAFEGVSNGIPVQHNKVGEFVTILSQQYQTQTSFDLNVNFSESIAFKFNDNINYISPIQTGDEAYEEMFSRFTFRFKTFFTLRKLRELFFGFVMNNPKKVISERLAKRVEFLEISRYIFVLIYDP